MQTLQISKSRIKKHIKKSTGVEVGDIQRITKRGNSSEADDWLEELTAQDVELRIANIIIKWYMQGG